MRSFGWAPIQYDRWPYKERKCYVKTETHWEDHQWWQRQILEWCSCQPRHTMACLPPPELGIDRKDSTRSLQRSEALMTTSYETPSLQNFERIHSCCFKPHSLWYFSTVALRNPYRKEGTHHREKGGKEKLQWEDEGVTHKDNCVMGTQTEEIAVWRPWEHKDALVPLWAEWTMRRKGGGHIRGVKEENNSRSVGHCMEFGFYAEIWY